jgi:hypothetical protein
MPVPLHGDINGGRRGRLHRLAMVRACFNQRSGDLGYNPFADINGYGIVDFYDLVIVVLNFGRTQWCRRNVPHSINSQDLGNVMNTSRRLEEAFSIAY